MHLTIIGTGFVGHATATGFRNRQHAVHCVDINPARVEWLQDNGFDAVEATEILPVSGDITFFTLPTPTVGDSIDLGPLLSGVEAFSRNLKNYDGGYHVVVVRSTVPPGTTRNVVIPLIEATSGKRAGRDFGVCMQPEYLRQVSAVEDFENPRAILIGELDKRSGDVLQQLYASFTTNIVRVDLEPAELQKYVHNVFNAVKIAYFNEMRQLIRSSGWSDQDISTVFEVTAQSCEGLWNPEYGIRDFGPFNGACLPKDTRALRQWATQNGHDVSILDTVIRSNDQYADRRGEELKFGQFEAVEDSTGESTG